MIRIFFKILSRTFWRIIGVIFVLVLLTVIFVIFFLPSWSVIGFLFFLMWSGGSQLLAVIANIFASLRELLVSVADIVNLSVELLPVFGTIWNILMKIVIFLFQGFLSIVCTVSPVDPTFNVLTHCNLLINFLNLAPILANIVWGALQFILFIIDLIAIVFKPIACLRDAPCTRFCNTLGDDPGCYGFSTLVTWIFTNFLEFLVNVYDFFLPFFYFLLRWLYSQAHVSELLWMFDVDQGLWVPIPTIYGQLEVIIASNGGKLTKVVIGLLIQFILAPIPDLIYCWVLSSASFACIGVALCRSILGLIGVGFLCPNLNCPCSNCSNGFGTLSPCTVVSGCICVASHTFLLALINFYNSL